MKQKLIGLAACLLALIVAFAATGLEKDTILERYHQHLESPNASLVSEGSGASLRTKLPIVTIDTHGEAISPDGTPKAEQTIADICFYDRQGELNSLENEPDTHVRAHIRVRGNSSRYFMKKQYKICPVDDNGVDLDVKLLGRGFAWLDTGSMDSLIEAGEFVKMVENRQGIQISAVEEIAYRNGWITKEKLLESAAKYGKSPYGQHLRKVAEGKIKY